MAGYASKVAETQLCILLVPPYHMRITFFMAVDGMIWITPHSNQVRRS